MHKKRAIKSKKGMICEKMLNYESELRELFEQELSNRYGVGREVVFGYFHLRYLVEYETVEKGQLAKGMADFMIKELHLPAGDFFLYKGERVRRRFQLENSLVNIMEDWLFTSSIQTIKSSKGLSLTYEEFIEKETKRLLRHGKNKAKAFKHYAHYSSYLKWSALELLNKQYGAVPRNPQKINGVEYPEEHYDYVRTLEEVHFANIHATELVSKDVASITEQDLEKYLIKNMELIEEGLRYLDKQVSIKDGRIDILARDKQGNYVIVELKVQEDKELIWQSVYYPLQFKKEHHVKRVRMLTVCPSYPSHILQTLKQIEGVEMVLFTPTIELGRIKSIETKKIS